MNGIALPPQRTDRPLPPGRATAPAGISLAMLARAAAAAPARQEPLPTTAGGASVPASLAPIILPSAQDRWLGQVAASYDPQRIESVLRGAVAGDLVAQWQLFDLMEDTSPRIKKNLNKRKRAVMSYLRNFEGWHGEDQPATPEADQRAKLVSRALWTMRPRADVNENGFDDTIYDILDAVGKGTALLEIDYELRESKIAGAQPWMIAPRCTRWIHPRYYGYATQGDWLGLNVPAIEAARFGVPPSGGPDGRVSAELQTLTAVDGIYARLPENKFLVCTYRTKSGHPVGGALLRSLAFWWAASNFASQWFLNFAQIFGLPIRWANYDPNTPGLLAQVLDMLENMGSAGYGAFPAGTTLELKEAMKSGADNPQIALLNFADKMFDLLILGQSGTSEVAGPGQSGGSYAANKVLAGVEQDIIESDCDFVEAVFNQQFIPALIRLNYGDEELLPELCLEAETVEDTKANAERDQILLQQGIEMPKPWFYKRHDIPLPTAGEETITGRVAASPFGVPPSGGSFGVPPSGGSDRVNAELPTQAHAAADATQKLIDNTLEGLTGVEARWLGGVKPFFHRLIALAQSGEVSDAEFTAALAKASAEMPELFAKLKPEALAESLENAMASAVVNGAVRGAMKRKVAA